jgi:hypothetical protein
MTEAGAVGPTPEEVAAKQAQAEEEFEKKLDGAIIQLTLSKTKGYANLTGWDVTVECDAMAIPKEMYHTATMKEAYLLSGVLLGIIKEYAQKTPATAKPKQMGAPHKEDEKTRRRNVRIRKLYFHLLDRGNRGATTEDMHNFAMASTDPELKSQRPASLGQELSSNAIINDMETMVERGWVRKVIGGGNKIHWYAKENAPNVPTFREGQA